jgi:hypothetical protein
MTERPSPAPSLARSDSHAACTAQPTLAIVCDPPCEGAGGNALSPSSKRTRSSGSPSVSAATWVIAVYVPGPMSEAALRTTAEPSAKDGRRRRRPRAIGGIERGGHAVADQPGSVAHRARLRRAAAPAEPLRGRPVAGAQLLARPRQVVGLVTLGIVRQPQLERVHVEGDGQLVHGALEREQAADLARRPHVRRRVGVHLDDPRAREHVRARVGHPGRRQRLLGVLLVGRRLPGGLVDQRGQPPVAPRSEGDALLGVRTEADRGVELAARELETHRPAGEPRAASAAIVTWGHVRRPEPKAPPT